MAYTLTSCVDISTFRLDSDSSYIFEDSSLKSINIPWLFELIGLGIYALVFSASFVLTRIVLIYKPHDSDIKLPLKVFFAVKLIVFTCVTASSFIFTVIAVFAESLGYSWAFTTSLTLQVLLILIAIFTSINRIAFNAERLGHSYEFFMYIKPFPERLSGKFLKKSELEKKDEN